MTQPLPTMNYATVITRPGVVTWYKVYCGAMAAMYLVAGAAGAWMLTEGGLATEDYVTAVILAVVAFPLAIAYIVGIFLPRSKGTWIYGIVLIAIGLTGCTLVAAIPLLIFWVNARTKDWYQS